jgi:hypothetical protein
MFSSAKIGWVEVVEEEKVGKWKEGLSSWWPEGWLWSDYAIHDATTTNAQIG